MQITTYTAPVTVAQVTHYSAARNSAEIIDRVVDATASVQEIGLFLRKVGHALTKSELKAVGYALARARYRAGEALDLEQLALLAEVSLDKARHYLKKLSPGAGEERIPNNVVSAVLCNIME